MKPDSPRWQSFATSPHPWEVEALAYLREALPDVDPIRVWALFDFVSNDGNISEVDALVLTAKGLYLIEIKSHPWVLTGDASTWTWKLPDGKRRSHENPVLGANRKAKRLRSLLEKQKALQSHRLPFVQPLVFLSHQDVDVQLDVAARHHVHTRSTILPALTQLTEREHYDGRRGRIDTPLANAIGRAMEQAGIKPSRRQRRFGNYELDELILEGRGYQDWRAHNASVARVQRRIRIYPTPPDADPATRQMLHRAARREFSVLQGIQHQGILAALDFHEGDQGPGVVLEFVEGAVRLDHFLADQPEPLPVADRLDVLRQIAEAIRYAHEKRLVHRALSPLSVLVHREADGRLRTRVYNWQTAAREHASTTLSKTGTYTVHLDDLVEPAAAVYMAPEAVLDPGERAEHLDVFGLGCIAFRLFADRPPADDPQQLRDRLALAQGLLLSATVDGALPELVDLIQAATDPKVAHRLSTGEFLAQLDRVEEALTRPDNEIHDNPTEATIGQRFPGGFVVKHRLGKGSSAVAFLVERDVAGKAEQRVLKLSLDPSKNRILEDEAKLLERLRHSAIVRVHGTLVVGNHVGILLDRAGEGTLADRLRRDGPIPFEHLQRFGDDLLGVLQYLDEQHVFHRDLKPDNIGVAPVGRGDSLHLVLFDFSLASAPASQFQAGTPAYLDPFLDTRGRRQFDPAAERYAAAVTLYEMTTGQLPRWGDGRSNPAIADDVELDLETHAFDPALRDEFTAFFHKALHRDFTQRFDTALDMKAAWHALFERADRPSLAPAADVTLDTPLRLIGLSNRAVNVLERDAVETVRDLLLVPLNRVTHRKGVGSKTRQELLEKIAELRQRFPAVEPSRPAGRRKHPPADADIDTHGDAPDDALVALDVLVDRLLPRPTGRAAQAQRDAQILRLLLATDARDDGAIPWPTQTDVAKQLNLTTVQVHQVLAKARERWRKLGPLTRVRLALVDLLRAQGGIASLAEALHLLVTAFAGSLPPALAKPCARQVLRAALEAEAGLDEPRVEILRRHDVIWVATSLGADDRTLEPADLVRYAQDLGSKAGRLANADPLPTPQRVVGDLRQVRAPEGLTPLGDERLVRLAATAAGVAVSSRLELYPRDMPADRTLRLAQGALLGAVQLTTAQLRDRVAARYPDAEALPLDPVRLAALLQPILPDLRWDPAQKVWRFQVTSPSSLAGDASLDPRPSTWSRPAFDSPEVTEARQFDERLHRALRDSHFLVLAVERRSHELALGELAARFARDIEIVSLEGLLLQRLRDEAKRRGVAWTKVLDADRPTAAPADADKLRQLVHLAAKDLGDAIGSGPRTVLVHRLGLLERYGLMSVLDRLRDRTQLRPSDPHALHGAWVLVANEGTSQRPMLDGKPIPVLSRAGFADVPKAWIQNAHREKAS